MDLLGEYDRSGGGKVVLCGEVEGVVFGPAARGEESARREEVEEEDALAGSGDDEDDNDAEIAGGVALPGAAAREGRTRVLHSRQRGMQRARERELVRQAARRGVAFGFVVGDARKRVEAVQGGRVVESSFAKGDWGVRWRV